MYYYYKNALFSFSPLYGLSKISADIYNGAPLRTLADNLKDIFFFSRDISSICFSIFSSVIVWGLFIVYLPIIDETTNFLS